MEALTGAVFGLVAWRVGTSWELPAYLYLAAVGVALACIDLEMKRLPNALTLPSYVVGGCLLVLAALLEGAPWSLLRAGIGLVVLYSFYLALALIKPGAMGFGDVKLAGVLGMYLGFLGWGTLAVGAFLGFLLGGVGGAALMIGGRAGRKTRIPFGPYMIAGALCAVLAGAQLAHAYTHVVLG